MEQFTLSNKTNLHSMLSNAAFKLSNSVYQQQPLYHLPSPSDCRRLGFTFSMLTYAAYINACIMTFVKEVMFSSAS